MWTSVLAWTKEVHRCVHGQGKFTMFDYTVSFWFSPAHTHSLSLPPPHSQSLTHVTDAIDRIKKKADKEYFIKTRGTGSLRPVERHGEI